MSIDLLQSLDSAFPLSICGSSTNAWIFFLACLSIFMVVGLCFPTLCFVMWAAWPVCWSCIVIYFLSVELATPGTLSSLARGAVTLSSSKVKLGFAPGGSSHLYICTMEDTMHDYIVSHGQAFIAYIQCRVCSHLLRCLCIYISAFQVALCLCYIQLDTSQSPKNRARPDLS